jgi:hypothetical protein
MAYRTFFQVRVECEISTLVDPEARQAFQTFCDLRVIRECSERGLDFDPVRYRQRTKAINRDPEGPGRSVQPFLLEYGFDFPELTPL